MNKMEIANLFIRAAIIDHRLPIQARPARLKAAWVPFVHSEEDVKSRIRTNISNGQFKEHLHPEDNPFEDWLHQMFDEDKQRLKPEDVADWERCNDLIKFVANEDNRRALWNWAIAKAGGKEFTKWCRSEGIHEMTGSRRKNRAIAVIEQYLVRSASPNTQSWDFSQLPVGAISEHISDNIAAAAPSRKERFSERDEDTVFCKEAAIFDWREFRNADRKRRSEAKKRRQLEAA